MSEQWLSDMKAIAFKGGQIALEMMDKSSPSLKPDKSVLTKADLAVSKLVKEHLKDYLTTKSHALIEEEDQDNQEYFDQNYLKTVPYLWVVDPIDGTLGYSNRMPNYGVSIGLLKNLEPWMGVVYFPSYEELFFCDGHEAYFVKKAFSKAEKITIIRPIDQTITPQSAIWGNDDFFDDFCWENTFCQVMMSSCAAVDLCWPAIGRGCGCFFKAHIWDFAGAWPIFRAAGLDLRLLKTKEVIDKIHIDLFVGAGSKTWKFKEHCVLSSKKNFDLIKSAIKDKI